jgi:galactosamine-6-phosphate isomerase
MQITYCDNYQEMSRKAASLVLEELETRPELLLCAATGGSPDGLYQELATNADSDRKFFEQLRILKLDEWGGIPEMHPVTCEYFLQNKLLKPLHISPDRYISFHSNPDDQEEECKRISTQLKKEGPIDICILGLGANGHLALNEPAAHLEPQAHVARLSEKSLQHAMIASMEIKPGYGLTLGMEEILSSRKIIMLVSGNGKKDIAEKFLEGKVSSELPASHLWQHPNVECLVEKAVLD